MSIRIRVINEQMVALCAARSIPKEGDVYLDDLVHEALSEKFYREINGLFNFNWEFNPEIMALVEQEESNNPNRDWWDEQFGTPPADCPEVADYD